MNASKSILSFAIFMGLIVGLMKSLRLNSKVSMINKDKQYLIMKQKSMQFIKRTFVATGILSLGLLGEISSDFLFDSKNELKSIVLADSTGKFSTKVRIITCEYMHIMFILLNTSIE